MADDDEVNVMGMGNGSFRSTPSAWVVLVLCLFGAGWAQAPQAGDDAAAKAGRVLVVPVSDEGKFMVDQVQAEFIIDALDRAEEESFARVVLVIDTFGGVVMSAREITERLLRLSIPTTAYVETKAISAGTFIAFACDDIVMEEKSTLGDAQMIMQTMEGIEEAPEKLVTVYRSDWKKACDAKGHPFPLALGFFEIDAEVLWVGQGDDRQFILREDYDQLPEDQRAPIIRVISKKGQLLTLHAGEAEELGLARVVPSLDDYLESAGFRRSDVDRQEMSWKRRVLRFLGANNWIFFVLVLVGLNGLYMEIKAPGFGIPGLAAIVCFAIVFGSRYLLGTASELEIFLFVVGVLLALAEIFVIPGFGVTGIAGLILIFGSLLLASLPEFDGLPQNELEWEWVTGMLGLVLVSFLASMMTMFFVLPSLLKVPAIQVRMLKTEFRAEDGYIMDTVDDRAHLVGLEGRVEGGLRPTGKVRLDDGRLLDVVADGTFIDDRTRVRINQIDGNRVIVRVVEGDDGDEATV